MFEWAARACAWVALHGPVAWAASWNARAVAMQAQIAERMEKAAGRVGLKVAA